ncbi:MAG TPA: tetratricopeptide repeat protein, partial [Vicinamibacteria bacterium]|nr:tetratricopeptide repeat protein [Vicinamibacteria bacterium]
MERSLPLLTGGARDLPARQQTLRNTIAWSYDLLEPGEQTLFRRLAVFLGCTLEAAEAVCSGEPPRPGTTSVALPLLELDVLDGLESLVEKSLLRQRETADGQAWYVMLATVREFALERLEESDEAGAVRRRHILHAMQLAETADVQMHGPQQATWFARLEQEHGNLRAALRWSEAGGYAEPAFRLAVALWWFWSAHGHVAEGRERLTSLLARFPVPEPAGSRAALRATLRAKGLYAAGVLAATQNDYAVSRALHAEGLALRRALDDPVGVVHSLVSLGWNATHQGDHAAARRYLEESVAIARELGDRRLYASVLHDLGNFAYEMGDLPRARAALEESVSLLRDAGDPWQLGSAILAQAVMAHEQGAFDEAEALASEALSLYQRAGERRSVALALAHLGGIALSRGDQSTSHDRLSQSIVIQQELGDMAGIAFV